MSTAAHSRAYRRRRRELRDASLSVTQAETIQRLTELVTSLYRHFGVTLANGAYSKEDSYNKKEDKEETKKDIKKETKSRGTRLPTDWQLTPERREIAAGCGLDPDITHTKFCNHWWSKPGKDGVKLDWDRTWHNWCLNDRRSKPNGHANGNLPLIEPISEAEAEDIKRRIRGSFQRRENDEPKL